MTRLAALLALFLLPLAAPASAQSNAEVRFVSNILNQLQPRSFRENREFCGFIGIDGAGRFAVGPIVAGGRDSCEPLWPDTLNVIASFHTHGGYDREAWSEIPSVTDIEADEADGVDGWVATPGGRLWYIDTTDMVVSQVCGTGCLLQDPKWRPETRLRIRQSYTYRELIWIENNT